MLERPDVKAGKAQAAHAPAGLGATRLVCAKTAEEACTLLAEAAKKRQSAMLLAGGTDVIVDRHLVPIEKATNVDLVVDVNGIADFRKIARERDHLVLGGGVTYWDLRKNETVRSAIPMLGDMAKDVGAVQIQTRGTLAGNIATASPAADGVAALMALDTVVRLESVDGTREVVLESFFSGYRKTVMRKDEIIVGLELRIPQAGAWVRWRKVGTRLAQAISKVALASVVEVSPKDGVIEKARFGMASVAAVTTPLAAVRTYLEGRKLADVEEKALREALARDITPIDDVRSTGEYRLHVAEALVRRALEPVA